MVEIMFSVGIRFNGRSIFVKRNANAIIIHTIPDVS